MSESPSWRAVLTTLRSALADAPEPFVTAIRHGSMRVELFAPIGQDTQKPHKQDELYIVSRGESWFVRAEERVRVAAGDVLFVPAGMIHRFEDFSDDLEVWVIFWGPSGGETGTR